MRAGCSSGRRYDGAVNRQRLTGLMLIGAALIVVMAISSLQGRPVAGTAMMAQPVPPCPQVGDCSTVEVTEQLWDQMAGGEVPVLRSRPCQGARLGEVISVEDGTSDTGQLDCYQAASVYLGLPAVDLGALPPDDRTETVWIPRTRLASNTFGPSPFQVAAGQHWLACVLSGTAADGIRPLPFQKSPRAAATHGGSAFNRFAACSDSPVPDRSISCDRPHRYEFIADAISVGDSEAASLASCRAKITELAGLTDPTAGNRLQIMLLTYTFDSTAQTFQKTTYQQAQGNEGNLTCAIAPTSTDEAFTGTLYGLNGRPLPIR